MSRVAAVQKTVRALAHLLPAERRTSSRIIEIRPEGRLLTYGLGISLTRMRNPALAQAGAGGLSTTPA